jgi:phospholipase/lecithinase/hemolysin
MIQMRTWVPMALAAALVVAACGGSDPDVPGSGSPAGAPTTKGTFTAVVSFGDSLSDIGAYTPATSATGNGAAPYIGGKFTTNTATSKIWVENVATTLGVAITPAQVGFGATSVACPAAAASAANTCTGYGQGGSRVTDVNGIGHATGALTVPVKTQIANHLARFTTFTANDLIFVYAGNNDVFTQFSTFATTATAIKTQAAAGTITQDQATLALFNAQTVAQAAIKQAAQELTGYIRGSILAKGGKYVAVMNLSDSAATPFGGTLPADAKGVLTGLVDTFNLWLRDGLTDQPVLWIDANASTKAVIANPAAFGIANTTIPACNATKIAAITSNQITDGSSLFCNATPGAPYNGLRTTPAADINTWLFADAVHPTVGGHKLFSDAVLLQLRAAHWID